MNTPRHAGVMSRLLITFVLVSLVGALAWATLAHHRVSGNWSFHPLDSAWWSPQPASQNGGDPFADVAQDAKKLADQAGQALWGPGGMVERGEAWWNNQSHASPEATSGQKTNPSHVTAPVKPLTAPAPSTSLRSLLEQRLTASEQRFADGLQLAKQARPSVSDNAATLAGRLSTLAQARQCFAEVERDLGESIPAYQAIPGHDASKVASAKQLQHFAQQMQELTRLTP